ncbi:DUF3618 domain-containing protein [Nocardia sp. NPDC055053]
MSEPNDPDAVRLDRDQARRELSDTVAELTDKLDVPARTKDKVHHTAEAAKHRITDAKYQTLHTADLARDTAEQALHKTRQAAGIAPKPALSVAAAVLAAVAVWLITRRRRS